MEDLKDLRRQLTENPESRELNNRYAQACLDIAKEYTVTSQGYIFICSPSDLEALQYIMVGIPNAKLLDETILKEYKCMDRAVTQARMNRFNPWGKLGGYYAFILLIVMSFMAIPTALLRQLSALSHLDHSLSPVGPIYLALVTLITAALLWAGWIAGRIPGWKYNALIVEENKRLELARAEAAARQSTDPTVEK